MGRADNTEHLMLIDGYGLIYRSYFAFINRPLTDHQGNNVSAVFGFFRSLFSLIKEYEPTRIAVAMDSRAPTFRHKLFPEYKAQRDKTPEDLHNQIPLIESILEKAGVKSLSLDGYEADDIIATVTAGCIDAQVSCTVVSNDKDLLQLVDDARGISALRYEKKSYVRYTEELVTEHFQVKPNQIADYLAMVGDSSDNIPGIKGIGAKGAAGLLQRYGDLSGVLDHVQELSSANRKKIEQGLESSRLSRELVTLKQIEGMCSSLPGTPIDQVTWEHAKQDFEAIGADTLAAQAGDAEKNNTQDASLKRGEYTAVTELDALNEVIEQACRAKVFSFDIETDSLNEMDANIAGFSIALKSGAAWYVALSAGGTRYLSFEDVKPGLIKLLGSGSHTCIGQNIKYDCKVLRRCGVNISCGLFDTMVAAWILDSSLGGYSMDFLAERMLGYTTIRYTDVVEKGATFFDVPLERAAEYAAEDADITFRLYELLSKQLKERSLDRLMYEMEMPVLRILAEMELAGILLVPEMLTEYSEDLQQQLAHIQQQVFSLCGEEFNIQSTKQLQTILFEKRGLKPVKKTKTGYSTDTSVLEVLALEDEVPRLILNHRVLSKLKSTYVDTLPLLMHHETGRIHTSYTQTGTATGRLSSRNPNLQNIPIRTEEGRKIRRAFIPRRGWSFVSADYAQVELVLLAHFADDPGLKEAFLKGLDVHSRTASLIFQIPIDQVSSEQRRAAKTINFGVMYGMSSFRLARELSISRKQADAFIEAYFQRYSGIQSYIDRVVKEAEQTGEVRTLMGRTRPVPGILSKNRMERMGAQRIAVNTPIQGSAADIMKVAMIRISDRMEKSGLSGKMLLQIHDEIILEVPDDEADQTCDILHQEMVKAADLKVPLQVTVETGKSWGDMH